MNVKAINLINNLKTEEWKIYMRVLKEADIRQDRTKLVWRIVKSLYKLKQLVRLWNKKLIAF